MTRVRFPSRVTRDAAAAEAVTWNLHGRISACAERCESARDAHELAAEFTAWPAGERPAGVDDCPLARSSPGRYSLQREPLRLGSIRFHLDEARTYLASERVADLLTAGHAVEATLGTDLPVMEETLLLAGGLLPSTDALVDALRSRAGRYGRSVAYQIAGSGGVSGQLAIELVQEALWLGSYRGVEDAVRAVARPNGLAVLPFLEEEEHTWGLTALGEFFPDEAIWALIRLAHLPPPGLQSRVYEAIRAIARHHPVAALDGLLALASVRSLADRSEIAIAIGTTPLPDSPAAFTRPSLRPLASPTMNQAPVPERRPLGMRGHVYEQLRRLSGPWLDRQGYRLPSLTPEPPPNLAVTLRSDPVPERWIDGLMELLREVPDAATEVVYAISRIALVYPNALGADTGSRLARHDARDILRMGNQTHLRPIVAAAIQLASGPDELVKGVGWRSMGDALRQEVTRSSWETLHVSESAFNRRLRLIAEQIASETDDPVRRRQALWRLVHLVVSDEPRLRNEAASDSVIASLHDPLPETITVGRSLTPISVAHIATFRPTDRNPYDAAVVLAERYPLAGLSILVAYTARSTRPYTSSLRSALEAIARQEPDTLVRLLNDGIALGDGAPPQLLQRHESPNVRLAVAEALLELGERRPSATAPILRELCNDPEEYVRGYAKSHLKSLQATHPSIAIANGETDRRGLVRRILRREHRSASR